MENRTDPHNSQPQHSHTQGYPQQTSNVYTETIGDGVEVTYNNPQRLHILTLLYNGLSFIPQILLPAIFVFFSGDQGNSTWMYIGLLIGIFALPSMYFGYMNYYYMFTETDFVVFSGVFSKKQRSVPFQRIQNVSLRQNILMRAFDLVAVSIETAGDAGKEAELKYVKSDEYERIKSIIGKKTIQLKSGSEADSNVTPQTGSSGHNPDTSTTETQPFDSISTTATRNSLESETAHPTDQGPTTTYNATDNVIYKMSLKEMVKFGALRLRPTILIIIAWVYGFGQQFVGGDFLVEFIKDLDIDSVESTIETLDYITLSLYVLSSVFVAFFISWLIDILLGVNTLWGFTLKKDGNKLFSERGFLNKVKNTIPLKKLQMAQYVTNPIKRYFGYYGLDLHTAGSPMQGQSKTETKAIPLATKLGLKPFVNLIIGETDIEDLRPVSKLTIRRASIRYTVTVVALCAILYMVLDIWWPIVLLLPISFLAAYVRWKYRGFAIRDSKIIVREGYFRESISIIPIRKIQNLHIYATFFQRRLGLVSLYIDTAAFTNFKDAAIVDISEDEAIQIRDEISEAFWATTDLKSSLDAPEYQQLDE